MVVVTIKKDDVVRWKQCVKHCGGYYYCLNMSIEHIRKDLIKLGALALSVAINRRGRERTDRLSPADLGVTKPTPEFPGFRWHSYSFKVKGPFCLSPSKGTLPSKGVRCYHLSTSKCGSINGKEEVSILLRDFREAFPTGNWDGQWTMI